MATTAIAALTREQKKVFTSMPKAWQTKAKRGMALQRTWVEADVLARHELGEICKEMLGDERNYGEEAVPNLAIVMACDPNVLWQCRQFVGVYTLAQVQKVMARSAKAGRTLTWSHFDALSGIEGRNATKFRKEMEQACITERMPVTELRRRIQAKKGGKSSKGGRTPNKPRSLAAGITEISSAAEKYENRWNGWDEMVFQGAVKAGADEVTPDLVRQLQEGRDKTAALGVRTDEALEKFDKALTRCKTVLKKKKAGADPKATPPKKKTATSKAATNGSAKKRTVKKKVLKRVKKKKAGNVKDRITKARRKRRPTPA